MSFKDTLIAVQHLASLSLPTDKEEIETWAQEQQDDLSPAFEWVDAIKNALDEVSTVLGTIGEQAAIRQEAVEDLAEAEEKLAQARTERKDATNANGNSKEDREALDAEIEQAEGDVEEAQGAIEEADIDLEDAVDDLQSELGTLLEELNAS